MRREKGLSQQALADLAFIDKQTLARFEKGNSPSVETLRGLAKAFGLSHADLLKKIENLSTTQEVASEYIQDPTAINRILFFSKLKQMSTADLAQGLGVTESLISQWKNGKKINRAYLTDLANVLEIHPSLIDSAPANGQQISFYSAIAVLFEEHNKLRDLMSKKIGDTMAQTDQEAALLIAFREAGPSFQALLLFLASRDPQYREELRHQLKKSASPEQLAAIEKLISALLL